MPNSWGLSVAIKVTTVPHQTTNITGLRTVMRGSSFRNDSTIARPTSPWLWGRWV